MALERSPFLKLDKSMVIGELKSAGTKDPDVLHGRLVHIRTMAAFPKNVGLYIMVMGGLCTAMILLAFIGIPLLIFGWWLRKRGLANLKVVEEAWNEFNGGSARVVGAVHAA